MIWVAFAAMTAAAVLCLVWPLSSRPGRRGAVEADVAFYRSQLAEVDDDVARGLVPAGDAHATRVEIGRRLLAAAARIEAVRPQRGFRMRRLGALALAVAVVPALALGLYLRLGHPDQPDLPIASRDPDRTFDLAAAIPKIEAHLAVDPQDGKGFDLLAPLYFRMGRFDDAARAYAASLRLLGERADHRAMLGQALMLAADGVVTAEARAAFEKALAQDPGLPQARYFLALAAEQDGDMPEALRRLRALQDDSPPDAPWQAAVRDRIASLSGGSDPAPPSVGPPAGPAAATVAALPPEQRLRAIRGMVDGLAARLAQNGRDPEGWLQLIRAYKVLGDPAKAQGALADARQALGGDAPDLGRVNDLARQLGLEG